jgi:hypothetical protein
MKRCIELHISENGNRHSTRSLGIIYALSIFLTEQGPKPKKKSAKTKNEKNKLKNELKSENNEINIVNESRDTYNSDVLTPLKLGESMLQCADMSLIPPEVLNSPNPILSYISYDKDLSKSTYKKFFNVFLQHRKKFKDIFIKYDIPYPVKRHGVNGLEYRRLKIKIKY